MAEPSHLVGASSICSYCGKDTSNLPNSDTFVGPFKAFQACPDHKAFATRNARKWMDLHGVVGLNDVVSDPLFKVLGMTMDHWGMKIPAPDNLTVKRSSGELQPGWSISCRVTYADPKMLQRDDEGKWRIRAEGPGGVTKSIIVDELTLSLPEDKHGLVDAFVARLNAGIYKADADAHSAAVGAYQKAGGAE